MLLFILKKVTDSIAKQNVFYMQIKYKITIIHSVKRSKQNSRENLPGLLQDERWIDDVDAARIG